MNVLLIMLVVLFLALLASAALLMMLVFVRLFTAWIEGMWEHHDDWM